MVRSNVLALALALLAPAAARAAEPAKKTYRVYFAGNSVTDAVNYGGLEKLFAAKGLEMKWGRHVIPGTPLFLLWKSDEKGENAGFTEKPYGGSIQAMTKFDWDAVTLQPFDRHLRDAVKNPEPGYYDETDVANAQKYISAQTAHNPDCQFYVYARWPRMRGVGNKAVEFDAKAYLDPKQKKQALPKDLEDWQKLWDRKYTGGWDGTEETRDYFEQLTRELRKDNPGMKKPVLMIPVGHVMAALDKKMKAGKIPGRESIWEVYNDGIHMDHDGSFIVGCTFFATITKQDPKDLPADAYGVKDEAFAKVIRETVWEVVSKEELAGVAPAK